MPSIKTRFSSVLAASALVLGACATTAGGDEPLVDLATEDQRAAAERADPLTRARFWAGEYQKEPENLETAKYFARSLRAIESHDRAVEVASDTLILYPADYDMLMILGRAYLSLNKPNLASGAFGKAIQVDGSRADAFAALGLAYDRAGQHGYAQRAYSKALAIDPERTATLTNYGLSLALSGNIDRAEETLKQAADRPDADMRVRQNLALVLGLQGKFEEMKTVDDAAPAEIMEKNAKILQRMIERDSPVPTTTMSAPQVPAAPAPTQTQTIKAAPSTPVASNGLGDVPTATDKVAQSIIKADTEAVLSTAPKAPKKLTGDSKTASLPPLRGSLEE